MVLSLSHLPQEILHSILVYCPPTSTAALEQTARTFKSATNEPVLWRFYCRLHFQFWDGSHEMPKILASPVSSIDWKTLYIKRHRIDRTTNQLMDSILETQTGRIRKFQTIIDFGYDAKDTLLRNVAIDSVADDVLARRYYAKALLGCLNRGIAVSEWAKLRDCGDVPLERALGAFDLFLPESGYGDLNEVTVALNGIATQLLRVNPHITHLTPRHKAMAIASYLRANNLTGIDQSREYHCLEHNFLGMALNSREHNSLPLVSAAIYCYVAQWLGLDARPCGFPFHVHVIITPHPCFDLDDNELSPGEQGAPIYMDPFRSETETSIFDLQNQLNVLGASHADKATYLGKSSISEIALRCGKNILNSVHYLYQFHDLQFASVDVTNARYAALWSLMLLSGSSTPRELRVYLPWLMELFVADFPWDIHFIEQYLVPLFQGMAEYDHLLESLHVMRAVDEMPKQVRRRTAANKEVRYKIGQVFRHRRYDYIAVITRWDAECDAGEPWMMRMGIDRLPRGRHQSFYHALVEDKSFRYVAEENIEPIKPCSAELPEMLIDVAGKFFKRWDEESRTFVSNVKDEYPDD